mgnify:CR=1 FL=1
MFTTFKNLKPFQLSEYIFLALFAFLIPISWRIATYVMIGLFLSCILKGIFEGGFKPNPSQYKNKLVYFIFIAFWLIYAISFLYSENTAEARIQIGKKLSFLLFPLYFLFSNLSYLNKNRVRTIIYCFVTGILTFLSINFVWAIIDIIFCNDEIERLISPSQFFKTNDTIFTEMHRAYFSIICCMSITFCFKEFFTSTSKKLKIFNLFSLLILTISPFFVTSRAGILCTVLLFVILLFWLAFTIKEKKVIIMTGTSIILILIISYFSFPNSINRFTEAIDKVKDGKGDIRIVLKKSCNNVIRENFVFGVGIGDRNDETLKAHYNYRDHLVKEILNAVDTDSLLLLKNENQTYAEYADTTYNFVNKLGEKSEQNASIKNELSEYKQISSCIDRELNAHNQFNDTIISVGIVGLLLFFGFFIYPIYFWIKNRTFNIVLFSLLIIITFNCLFESVFERQMGIMFFVFFYFLLFHGAFCQQTTSNRFCQIQPTDE